MKTPLLLAAALVAPAILHATDEYTFDLNKPPVHSKEAFAIALAFQKARQAGPSEGFSTAKAIRLHNALAPSAKDSPEKWAAHRWAVQQMVLSHQPNFEYFAKLRTQAKDNHEIINATGAWTFQGFTSSASIIANWALEVPSLPPKTPPGEVRKLRRYAVRLAARIVAHVESSFEPDYVKKYATPSLDLPARPVTGARDPNLPPPTQAELDAYRLARRDQAWKLQMSYVHMNLGSSLHFIKAELCAMFRTHLPGDKESIREMLVEAGYKTSAQRKAYWQFCRTTGAYWSMWESADEDRLVTD